MLAAVAVLLLRLLVMILFKLFLIFCVCYTLSCALKQRRRILRNAKRAAVLLVFVLPAGWTAWPPVKQLLLPLLPRAPRRRATAKPRVERLALLS